MGFVDRGGGREAKGASLRRSKKNPGAAAARTKTEVKANAAPLVKIIPVQPLLSSASAIVDCSVAILSRKFDSDRDRMLERANSEAGCGAIVAWCGEFERQEALSSLCSEKPGQLYCVVGVHPDNVDRTNKKAHQGWAEQTEQLAKHPQCVAVLSGLDLTREQATHFSQEALMKLLFAVALKHTLPVCVHLTGTASAERFVELFPELLETQEGVRIPVVVHGALSLATQSKAFARFLSETPSVYSMVSAQGLFDESLRKPIAEVLSSLPRNRLLLASDSPWFTPQNIDDEHLRTLHNDPANVGFVLEAIVEVLGENKSVLSEIFQKNTIDVFFSGVQARIPVGTTTQAKDDENSAEESSESEVDCEEENHDQNTPNFVAPVAGASVTRVFSCVKCRTVTFTQTSLITHTPDAPRASFKGKQTLRSVDGACETTFFLPLRGENLPPAGCGIVVVGDSVNCSGCSCKMGTAAVDAPCPCGATLVGSTARIIASRVELFDSAVTDQDLLSRAERERDEQVQKQEDDSESGSDGGKSRKKKPKQNVKANNRSNMSHYRNKNWTPGLSDAVLEKKPGNPEEKPHHKKNRKGRRGQSSDESN